MGKDWAGLREEIRNLYHVDNKPLGEVMSLMRGRHNFVASQRSYRAQFKKWGYTKYNRRVDPKQIKRFSFEGEKKGGLGGSKGVEAERSKQADGKLDKKADVERIMHAEMERNMHADAIPNLNPLRRRGRIKRRALQTRLRPITFPPANQYLSANTPANPYLSTITPTLPSLLNEDHHHVEPPSTQTSPLRLPETAIALGQDELNCQDVDGRTQLHRAVLCKDTTQVRMLLVAGAVVDVKDHTGNEAIHYSVVLGGGSILELLLRFGADINARGSLGRSPIHRAASSAFDLFEAAIKAGAEVSAQDENGDTPLHLAISAALDGAQLIRALDLEAVINSGCDVNLPNEFGLTPFVKLLDRPYSQAAVLDAIHSCLLRGGSADEIQPDGRTPFQIFLSRSVTQGSRWIKRICGYSQEGVVEKQILETFLEKGASISTVMPSGASLYAYYFDIALEPLWRQDVKMMDVFCRLSPPGPLDSSGDCILHRLAANCGPLSQAGSAVDELMQLQLDKGADPNSRNADGKTPLLCLFESSGNATRLSRRAMKPLLNHGADSWQQDLSGTCALFEAAKGNSNDRDGILRAFLEADLRHMDTGASYDEPKDRFCWNDWDSAIKAAEWSESKGHILDRLSPLPAGVDEAVRGAALSVLAGKHIQLSKSRFNGDAIEAENRHDYVANILRDCRTRDLFVDMVWVDHLLELCIAERSETRSAVYL